MKSEKRPQLKALTSLRFFAAMHVVLFHYLLGGTLETYPPYFANFIGYGYSGVSLFFVLSGFILIYNYADRYADAAGLKARNLKVFWVARFARIYPLYLVALVLSLPGFIARIITNSALTESAATLFLTPALLQAWTPWTACQWNCPGWSLSAEAFFYALFPFAAVYIAQQSNLWSVLWGSWLLSLAAPLVYLTWIKASDPSGIWLHLIVYCPLFHLPQFMIGVSAGLLLLTRSNIQIKPHQIKSHHNLQINTTINRALSGIKFDAATFTLAVILLLFVGTAKLPYLLVNNGLLAPLFAFFIYTLSSQTSSLAKCLALPGLVILGEASYSMYLIHLPLNSLIKLLGEKTGHADLASSEFLLLRLLLLIGVAILMVIVIEKPARKLILKQFLKQPDQALVPGR